MIHIFVLKTINHIKELLKKTKTLSISKTIIHIFVLKTINHIKELSKNITHIKTMIYIFVL